MSETMSPTLSSYAGLSGNDLIGLADLQSTYNQNPPLANQDQALQFVQAAMKATDPNLKSQLLQDAIDVLTPGGASPSGLMPSPSPASSPVSSPISAPVATPVSSMPAGNGVDSSASGLSVNGNSVDTGEYTITGSTNDDGSLTITKNQTGQSTEVWGDPHVKVDGQDTADFQKDPLNIQLQDGTVVHIDPTALNSNGVAHIGQVSITKGDQTVTMGGASSNGFEGAVNTSGVMNGVSSYSDGLFNSPDATNVTLGADGNLYYDNANGSMGSEVTAASGGGETDLDGAGGGLVGDPASAGASGASSSDMAQQIQQLESMLENFSSGFDSTLMQSMLSQMQSTSG